MRYNITVAKTAGFCFGVNRAVELVYNELDASRKTATFGEIIHNPTVVNDLCSKGVKIINSPDEIDSLNTDSIVIRSHGVSADIYESLKAKAIKCIDGTCPYVKRIHNIVSSKSEQGYDIVILGNKDHPEVQGIVGNCKNSAIVIINDCDLYDYLKKINKIAKKKVAIVAQTTYNVYMWDKCMQAISTFCDDIEVFNTICSATSDKQNEATALADNSDVMIIVGGKHSSNTLKLYDICKKHCSYCLLVQDADELRMSDLSGIADNTKNIIKVGITAGASTPAYIIKEVQNQMSEILQNMDEDFNFEEALDASFKRIYTGNRVKGYITAVNNTEAIVDVGTKHTGYVSLSELTDDPSLKPSDIVKVGDEVDFIVIKINDAEGIVNLSKKKVDAMVGFDKIAKAKEEDAILEGTVMNVVKGGILVLTNGIKVFIPASQSTTRRDEKLDNLLKKTVKFKIIEVNEQRGKAVGSIKAVLNAERDSAKNKFWDNVEVGQKFKGEVKSITNYGAFVDLGGIDGMIHISELSWNRIKHPSEVVSVGDVVEVYVKELDKDANRISLGYKKDEDNPWTKFQSSYSVGDVVKAKIVSITPFGAFGQIMPGIDGLIHISQIADKRVTNVKDVLSIGDEVEAKITEIDADKKRISMSIRALSEGSDEASADAE